MTRSPLIGYALSALSGALLMGALFYGCRDAGEPSPIRPTTVTADARLTAERDSAVIAAEEAEGAARESALVAATLRARLTDVLDIADHQGDATEAYRASYVEERDRADALSARIESLDPGSETQDPDAQSGWRAHALADSARVAERTARALCDTALVASLSTARTLREAVEVSDQAYQSLDAAYTASREALGAERDARLAADARADLWQTEARHQSRAAARWKTAAKVGAGVGFVGGALLILVATQ